MAKQRGLFSTPSAPTRDTSPPPPRAKRMGMERREWLLSDPKIEPSEYEPGTLFLHVYPFSRLAGRHLAWWQLIRYEMDPDEHRVMALGRAVPVSAYPGASLWIPAGETVATSIQTPVLPIDRYETAASADVIAAAREREAGTPATMRHWPLENWDRLEDAATRAKPDDPTNVKPADQPTSLDNWQREMVAILARLGAREQALRRMLSEMGLQGATVAELLSKP